MRLCKVGIAYGEELLYYSFPGDHPMNRRRIETFFLKASEKGIFERENVVKIKPEKAKEEEILLFHSKDYLTFVKEKSEEGKGLLDDGDTPAFKGVYEASAYVVGTTLKLVDMIMENKIEHGFNPMGGLHHARKNSAAGFCVFNDICIAIMKLRVNYGLNRILYFDIDAHHGDGVYYSFEEEDWLYFVDVHEDGRYLYPGTGRRNELGRGKGYGKKINIPLMPYSGDEEFLKALESVDSFLEEAKPEFVILQAGGDGLKDDPITHLRYSKLVHEKTSERLHKLSHKYANGRLLVLGGGGYNPEKVSEAWIAVVEELLRFKD